MDRRTKQDIQEFIKTISKSVTKEEYKDILEKATKPTLQSIKSRVPVHRKVVNRYIDGKVVAKYYPGNLKRSIQILDKLNKKQRRYTWRFRVVFFGAKLNKGKTTGTFKDNRVDPYYAHMIEHGTARNIKGVGYFKRGVKAGESRSLNMLKLLVSKRLNDNFRKNGLK